MSWYGRPPMMHGMQQMQMMHGMQGMVQMPPQMVPMPVGGNPRGSGPRAAFQPHYSRPPKRDIPTGPPVTVFVGNITERAPDAMVRHLLTTCGPVISWKRVQGATGKLQAFGFCEYSNPDAGLRAIRLLHNWTIADKTLVVKVDAKTQKVLDGYKADRLKKMNGGKSPHVDETTGEDYLDDDMKYEDGLARDRIAQILQDHAKEIESYVPKEVKTVLPVQPEKQVASTLLQRMGTRDEGLDGVDIEDEKKGIIHREIDKFRETMKIREAEKEEKEAKENQKDTDKDRGRSSPRRDRSERRRTRSKSRERDIRRERGERDRDRDSSASRDRGSLASHSQRGSRRRTPSKSRSPPARFERNRTRSPSTKPPRFDRDRASPSSRAQTKSQSQLYKEREMEDEEKEIKKAERKARDKEANYQERLRNWEVRESKKAKDYDKEKAKEKKKADEQEREAKKLKEFLEDYDDERDDPKFYKGRELARRLADREREAAKDAEDRRKELEEIEALKAQIYSDPKQTDPLAEFQRQLQERERQYVSHVPQSKEKEVVRLPREESSPPPSDPVPERELTRERSRSPEDQYEDNGAYDGHDSEPMPSPEPEELPRIPLPEAEPVPIPEEIRVPVPAAQKHKSSSKRKKLPVADIFNQDQEEETVTHQKKKLKSGLPPITTERKKEDSSSKSADDKRKHIKSLIEKIPTDKLALFAYNIDWDLVDNQLMEKRIRPWVNKKIAEYIGEPEPTLTDFICSKVLAGSTPKAILEDVQMVLDEEAEVFVVKMWRLLIYEIENKKQKAAATSGK